MAVRIKVKSAKLTEVIEAAKAMADAIEGFINAGAYRVDGSPQGRMAIDRLLASRAIFIGTVRQVTTKGEG